VLMSLKNISLLVNSCKNSIIFFSSDRIFHSWQFLSCQTLTQSWIFWKWSGEADSDFSWHMGCK
jgi:hypothetical protein